MEDSIIKVQNLTKDYGKGRGVFGINLDVRPGEVFGYVGTNGSGKTTTIRQMMGFIKPDKGNVRIRGLDTWKNSTELMKYVSYVPGEIAFPTLATGTEFLKLQAEYLGVRDFTYMNHIIEILQLDPTANLKRMSKGMKQKTAIVAALMGEKNILVLDEPTTGLDPLMREAFLELIREEKKKGSTIFMSSHIFEEIEEVCDRVAMIKDGRIIDVADLYQIRHWNKKKFQLVFSSDKDLNGFVGQWKNIEKLEGDNRCCSIEINKQEVGQLFQVLSQYSLISLNEIHLTLEQYFRQMYDKEEQ